MPRVVGVKFDGTPKVYTFAAGDLEYTENCRVVVETARGQEIGTVRSMPHDIPDDRLVAALKDVVRIATPEDIARAEENLARKPETLRLAGEKAEARRLNMKFVDCEYTVDGSKLVLFFTSEGRVDFRDLVKDLASQFRMRIELRQIGARDECKMIGGYGPCGRVCCCVIGCERNKTNIKMAKNQGLSLNPTKISGMCGRLMCCLAFENDYYAEVNMAMPRLNSQVRVLQGGKELEGTVIGVNQLKMSVRLRTKIKEDTFEINDYPLSEIIVPARGPRPAEENGDSAGDGGEEGGEETE